MPHHDSSELGCRVGARFSNNSIDISVGIVESCLLYFPYTLTAFNHLTTQLGGILLDEMAVVLKGSIVALFLFWECHAFAVTASCGVTSFGVRDTVRSVGLMAKKRRKRKDDEGENSSDAEFNGDDLPDFDIEGEGGDIVITSTRTSSSGESEITDAMMGNRKQLGTINDLLSDRSLEAKFKFEEPDEPLPDLVELAKAKSSGVNVNYSAGGSKRDQQAARKAAAIAANKAEEEEEENFFSKLPFKFGKNESGEDMTAVQVRYTLHSR